MAPGIAKLGGEARAKVCKPRASKQKHLCGPRWPSCKLIEVVLVLQSVFRYTAQVLVFGLTVKLVWNGLWRRYRCFYIFLILTLAQSIVLFGLRSDTLVYVRRWSIVSPLVWVSQAAAVLEVFAMVCEHYPRIGNFADVLLKWCLIPATAAGCALAAVEWRGSWFPSNWFQTLVLAHKAITWGCLLLVSFQAALCRILPVPMNRNLQLHRRLLCTYCVSIAVAWVFVPLTNALISDGANTMMISAQLLIFGTWLVALRPAGEFVLLPVGPQISEEECAAVDADFEAGRKALAQITWRGLLR